MNVTSFDLIVHCTDRQLFFYSPVIVDTGREQRSAVFSLFFSSMGVWDSCWKKPRSSSDFRLSIDDAGTRPRGLVSLVSITSQWKTCSNVYLFCWCPTLGSDIQPLRSSSSCCCDTVRAFVFVCAHRVERDPESESGSALLYVFRKFSRSAASVATALSTVECRYCVFSILASTESV